MSQDAPHLTIAIDGPAASGKTTLGHMLAQKLGYLFLDTGSMYRAVTLAALQGSLPVDDEAAMVRLAQSLDIEILPLEEESDGRLYTVLLNGKDVTWELRSPAVNAHVSTISAFARVRQELVRRQRLIGRDGRVVMVGRDIGTVVLPDAPLKLYVVASPNERARRRWKENQKRGGKERYEEILADVERRDQIDSNREHSPLRPAADAILIDTTGHSPEDLIAYMMSLVEQEAHQLPGI